MNQKLLHKFIAYWLPALLWAGIIFVLSANPTTSTSQIQWQDFVIKKTLHVLFFGTQATLLYRALISSGVEKTKAGYTAIILTAIYGATDELHQSFTPGRMPRAYDVFFDTIGAILAIFTIWKLLPQAPKRLRILAEKLSLS
jgi:VanZ family protein